MLLFPLIQGLRIIDIYIILFSLLLWARIAVSKHSTMPCFSTIKLLSLLGLEAHPYLCDSCGSGG